MTRPAMILLAALVLCGCQTVKSKKPVGDKVEILNPNVWNAKWQAGDGSVLRTKIKDSKLGIVELTGLKPSPKPGEPKEIDLLVRTLGTRVIVNSKMEKSTDPYDFGRVAIDQNHFVIFGPNTKAFATLIKKREIAGTVEQKQARQAYRFVGDRGAFRA